MTEKKDLSYEKVNSTVLSKQNLLYRHSTWCFWRSVSLTCVTSRILTIYGLVTLAQKNKTRYCDSLTSVGQISVAFSIVPGRKASGSWSRHERWQLNVGGDSESVGVGRVDFSMQDPWDYERKEKTVTVMTCVNWVKLNLPHLENFLILLGEVYVGLIFLTSQVIQWFLCHRWQVSEQFHNALNMRFLGRACLWSVGLFSVRLRTWGHPWAETEAIE